MKKNAVNGKNIQPSDEEIIAFLNDWLTNSLFTYTNKKIAVQELIGRYIRSKLTIGRIKGIIKKQQKEIEELKDLYSDDKIRNTIINRYREVIEKDYISKEKIKEKLKEVSNGIYDAKGILEKLLEEN